MHRGPEGPLCQIVADCPRQPAPAKALEPSDAAGNLDAPMTADYEREFRLAALLFFDVDEDDLWQAILFLRERCDREPQLAPAVRATLDDLTPRRAAQILEDLGWDEFCAYVLASARAQSHAWRLRDLRAMPYREYLQTPEWHTRAQETYARFGFRCALCNDDRDLNAHHRTYERRGCELPTDLTALCAGCHALFHEWRDLVASPGPI
jgi:hypothetical protein